MTTCITPYPEANSPDKVAGGILKKFPQRLFAVPPRISLGYVPGVTAESYQEDNRLWKKHVNAYKRINKLIGSGRYRNMMDMNAGLGGFAAALESPKSWVMNVVPTISEKNTLGVIYERGLIGIYHDWYFSHPLFYSSLHLISWILLLLFPTLQSRFCCSSFLFMVVLAFFSLSFSSA